MDVQEQLDQKADMADARDLFGDKEKVEQCIKRLS